MTFVLITYKNPASVKVDCPHSEFIIAIVYVIPRTNQLILRINSRFVIFFILIVT
jgi:hypothetical protein